MAPEEIVTAVRRRPFVPFRVTLPEGSTYDVTHPEFCMVGKRSAIIGLAALDDHEQLFERSVTLDLLHIVKLEALETSAKPKSNGAN